MNRWILLAALFMLPLTAAAQPDTDVDMEAKAEALHTGLSESYNSRDFDAMGHYLHPEIVIIFPDGRVLNGMAAFTAYVDEMIGEDDPIVQSFASDPKVEQRFMYGDDTIISQGQMNDTYVLTDGAELALESVFTATLVRIEDGPEETSGFVIKTFHCSTNAFDNDVLDYAIAKTATTTGLIAGISAVVVGLVIGFVVARLLGRKSA